MREMIDRIAAEAENAGRVLGSGIVPRRGGSCNEDIRDLPEHPFPGRRPEGFTTGDTLRLRSGQAQEHGGTEQIAEYVSVADWSWEEERERRIYRGRTIRMLRRYMRYSIERLKRGECRRCWGESSFGHR